ncbi:hypothetical protein ACFJGW_13995 [Burkholderiaceae bacterium UC74_6]
MKWCSNYFARLSAGKIVLWCYLIWYLCTVAKHFDPSPAIWLNSLGISVVVGIALLLSVGSAAAKAADPWQTFRLFFMPFAVSSFSSLIKGHGFILVFPPSVAEAAAQLGACALFLLAVFTIKRSVGNGNA